MIRELKTEMDRPAEQLIGAAIEVHHEPGPDVVRKGLKGIVNHYSPNSESRRLCAPAVI